MKCCLGKTPPPIFAIFAHTGHVLGWTTFQIRRRVWSLIFLPLSLPSIIVPATGGFWPQPAPLPLRVLPSLPRSARAPQKSRLPRRPSPNRRLCRRVQHRGPAPCRDHRPDRVRPRLACLSGPSDGEAAFGPHLHPDAPTYSISSWECTPCYGLQLWARRSPSTRFPAC